MSIAVINEVNIYEKDNVSVKVGEADRVLIVKSDWNCDRLVHLEYKDMKISLSAIELKTAIDNATNISRF